MGIGDASDYTRVLRSVPGSRHAGGGSGQGWAVAMSGLIPVATTVAAIGGTCALFVLIGMLGAIVIALTGWIASKLGLML